MLPRVPLKSFSLPIFRPAPGSPAWVGGCWQCGSWRSSPFHMTQSYATFLRVDYADGEPETYLLPLAFAAHDLTQDWDGPADALVAEVRRTEELAVEEFVDATRTSDLPTALLNAIAGGDNPLRGVAGEIVATRTPAFSQIGVPAPTELRPVIAEVEQNHTSVVYEQLVLKLFRRLEAGTHPEVEIGC